ncbi:MAG: hypothetical protein ACNA8H_12410 [Anaerolineales bacterium]
MNIANLAQDEDFKILAFTAIDLWGAASQLRMLSEECAELIVAQNHLERGRINFTSLMEELADVEIMLAQIRVLYQDEAGYLAIKSKKLSRLGSRVDTALALVKNCTNPRECA